MLRCAIKHGIVRQYKAPAEVFFFIPILLRSFNSLPFQDWPSLGTILDGVSVSQQIYFYGNTQSITAAFAMSKQKPLTSNKIGSTGLTILKCFPFSSTYSTLLV